MLGNTNNYIELYLMLLITLIIVLITVVVNLILEYNDFSKELKYLKLEIKRTRGNEREVYMKRKRRLILSYIFPFIKY